MIKETITGKAILSVGAAAVFCGATLYAVGQTLSYLFRDVDPDRIAQEGESEEHPESDGEELIEDPVL